MLYFENDYTEGACPEVLQALLKTNSEKLSPYGSDLYSESAKEKIRIACGCPEADVYLLCGGTQTNRIVIDAMLAKFEGVISAVSGHINQHEAGAIESAGHKIIDLPEKDGKLPADTLARYLQNFYADENREHLVFPGMVYISHPTEYGTLYTKAELQKLSEICHQYSLPLYMDGARLGYGLCAEDSDLSLPEIAALCDVFYIGGTKVGALCGEAVVFTKKNTPRQFFTMIKQNGALLAKGRLLGVQFDRLFTDDLYISISRNAIRTAALLRNILTEYGYRFYLPTTANQIFLVMEDEELEEMRKNIRYCFWEKADETHTVIRLTTSWATTESDVLALIPYLKRKDVLP